MKLFTLRMPFVAMPASILYSNPLLFLHLATLLLLPLPAPSKADLALPIRRYHDVMDSIVISMSPIGIWVAYHAQQPTPIPTS